jgi:hypothetical protein
MNWTFSDEGLIRVEAGELPRNAACFGIESDADAPHNIPTAFAFEGGLPQDLHRDICP